MIVRYDSLNRLERPNLTLCNPGSVLTGGKLTNVIGGIPSRSDEEIIFNFNSPSEFNFRAYDATTNETDEDTYTRRMFSSLQNRRLVFVDDIGFFMITDVKNGSKDRARYKDVNLTSIECELSQRSVPFIEDGTYVLYSEPSTTPDIPDTPDARNEGMINRIVSTIPLWEIGYVDKSLKKKFRTFQDIDFSKNCLSFLLEEIQNAYECVILFDCIKREINVYSQDSYVDVANAATNIHLTNDDMINSIDMRENADDLYTALTVYGDKDLTINAVNPVAGNVLYDFSYYLSWMDDTLSNKVRTWQNEVDGYMDRNTVNGKKFNEDIDTKYDLLVEKTTKEQEIEKLNILIKMYERCRDNIIASYNIELINEYELIIEQNKIVNNDTGEEVIAYGKGIENFVYYNPAEPGGTGVSAAEKGSYPAEIDLDKATTRNKLTNEIDRIRDEKVAQEDRLKEIAKSYKAKEDAIFAVQNRLSLTEYFTSGEMAVLNMFIFEGIYKDEFITVTDIMTPREKLIQERSLLKNARAQQKKVSLPTQEFTIGVENFIFEERFKNWSEQLKTGCLINVEVEEGDVAPLFLSSMTINYEDFSLQMTFGNRYNKFDVRTLFKDVLGNISKSTNSLNYVKDLVTPIKDGSIDKMKESLQTSRDIAMNTALSSDGEEVIIDSSGYTGRKKDASEKGYGDKQIKIVGNSIVFTNDDWKTCKLAIGEIPKPAEEQGSDTGETIYGINGNCIYGDIIIGERLKIKAKDSEKDVFSVMEESIEANLSDTFQGEMGTLESRVTSVEGTANGIQAIVTSAGITEEGASRVKTGKGYTFGDEGLLIEGLGEDDKTNITNKLDNSGMTVGARQGSDTVVLLEANNKGVNALRLTAREYLAIGDNSRFEDYPGINGKRTACFYIGG